MMYQFLVVFALKIYSNHLMYTIYHSSQITLSSTWTFEDFKSALSKDISSPPISDFNLKVGTSVASNFFLLFSMLPNI